MFLNKFWIIIGFNIQVISVCSKSAVNHRIPAWYDFRDVWLYLRNHQEYVCLIWTHLSVSIGSKIMVIFYLAQNNGRSCLVVEFRDKSDAYEPKLVQIVECVFFDCKIFQNKYRCLRNFFITDVKFNSHAGLRWRKAIYIKSRLRLLSLLRISEKESRPIKCITRGPIQKWVTLIQDWIRRTSWTGRRK